MSEGWVDFGSCRDLCSLRLRLAQASAVLDAFNFRLTMLGAEFVVYILIHAMALTVIAHEFNCVTRC